MSAESVFRCIGIGISTVTGAALLSLSAVASFVFGLGVVFLPFEAQRSWREPCVAVTHCSGGEQGRPLVWLSRSLSHSAAGWHHQLGMQAPSASSPVPKFIQHSIRPASLAASPDGRHIFIGGWDGVVYRSDLSRPDDAPLAIGRQESGCARVMACSADGRYLLTLGNLELRAWNLASNRLQWVREGAAVNCFVIDPDSQWAICGSNDGRLLEIDLQTGDTLATISRARKPVDCLSVSSDGKLLASSEACGHFVLRERAADGNWLPRDAQAMQSAPWRLAVFSPNGEVLLTCAPYGSRLVAWNLKTGERLFDLEGHTRPVLGAKFADANTLVSWGIDGTIRTWNLNTQTTTGLISLPHLLPAS